MSWEKFNPKKSMPRNVAIEAEVKHCNENLKLENEIVKGSVGEDNFYLEDGFNELSWNWNIIKWRVIDDIGVVIRYE